ncbi:MAG: sugar ABC transporter substrate-binding protein, partial [Longimicrobiales bacterium]
MRTAMWLVVAAAASACDNAAANDVETIRFWGMGREGEVVAQLIEEFERGNPGIEVHAQQIPWTAAHEKLLTAHVGDATPDVAQLGNTWIPEFAAIHALEPLGPWIEASASISPASYFDGIWATNIFNDTIWGVPWYVDTRLVFYRSDILAAAGYDSLPQSWDGWVEAMRAVKDYIGPDRYPLFLPTNEWAQPVIFGLQNDAALLSDDAHGAFSAPAFREAFEFYLSLYRSGLAPTMGQFDVANPYQEFERGFFTMWITGPWNMGEFKRRLPPEMQDRWATAPLPGPVGVASGYSHAGGASLVMFSGSRHKDAAWKLIEFLSRPEQQIRFYELTGSLPAHIGAWRRSDLANDEHASAFWEQLQRVRPLPAVPEIES